MTVTHCTAFSIATSTKMTGSENLEGRKDLGAMSNIMVSIAKARHDIAGEGRGIRSASCSDKTSSLCSRMNR